MALTVPDGTSATSQDLTGSDELKTRTLNDLRRMLDYRRQYDARRSLFFRQYIGHQDQQKFPDNVTNRSNTFVPYPLSNVETIVSRTHDAFFAMPDWFECSGESANDDHAAEAMGLVLSKKLHEAKLINIFEQFTRNCGIYGHAGLKIDWNWDFKTITKPVAQILQGPDGTPIPNPQTGQPIVTGLLTQTFQVPMACPRITPIDVYDLLIDPDGKVVAHLAERQLGVLKRENEAYMAAQPGLYLYDPQVLAELERKVIAGFKGKGNPDSVLIRFAEVWNVYDNTTTTITFGDDSDAIAWKDQRAAYRAMSYSSYRLPVWTGSGDVLFSGDNPFAHKRIPIVFTSYIKLPNEIYGLGVIETTADLTESLNRFVNMITDNWNLGVNRRYAYDENADIDHEALNQFNVPGGKVAVGGKPDEVLFPLPMFTPSASDYQILELYRGMIEMTSGISDFYGKGVGSSGGNDTATGINSVITESNYRFKLFIRNLDVDVLTPMLEMCASMCQQYLTDQQEVQITRAPAPGFPKWAMVQPEDLIGNFEFQMASANYATNKVVRQRNLMAFFQIASQTPYWNQGEGLREIGKVMEIANLNDLIKSDQEVQQEQQEEQQHQLQMALLQKVVDVEGKIDIAKAKNDSQVASGGQGKAKEGRPAKSQHEGAIPGASSAISMIKSLGQQTGANAMGLGDMGEVPSNG